MIAVVYLFSLSIREGKREKIKQTGQHIIQQFKINSDEQQKKLSQGIVSPMKRKTCKLNARIEVKTVNQKI